MDERQWVQAIQKGDKRYLQDIAEKYYDDIFRFCAFQTGSREDAYDMAQETFLRFIRYVEGYHERNLKGYLLTIAMNVCRDYLRRKGREDAVTVRCGEEWHWAEAAAAASGGVGRKQRDKAAGATGGTGWQQRNGVDTPVGIEWRQRNEEDASGGTEWRQRDGDTHGGAEWRQRDVADMPSEAGWRQRDRADAPDGTGWQQGDGAGASRVTDGRGAIRTSGLAVEANQAANPERHAVEADVHRRLMQALAQLPDMQREAILLHYLYDMKYREIGRLTDASVSTVKSRVRQGMERLQNLLRREDFLD